MTFKYKTFGTLIVYFIALIVLISCQSSPNYIPVDSRKQPPGIKLDYHLVRSGETLFSIAWLYGMDFRELADTNRITRPYLIRPGQRLSLRLKKPRREKVSAGSSGGTRKGIKSSKKQQTDSKKVSLPAPVQKPKYAVKESVRWAWPGKGPVIKKFSLKRNLNKGIDIGGKLGEPVLSAGDGTVVYAGSGLLGYGNLIIIKHNQEFLSAYGHNSRLLVAEGKKVKVGQAIAEIGSSGTDQNKLHFEVRREGKPVNPLYYLPRR